MTTKRPTRRAIKQAIRNVARLTGITIRQARPLIGDKVFLRNTDHFIKAKRCYPVSVSGSDHNTDLGVPFEVTFEFQKNGKFIDHQPSASKPTPERATLTPVAKVTSKLPEPTPSYHLLNPPAPMKPMTREKFKEFIDKAKELFGKDPVVIMSTPSRVNEHHPWLDIVSMNKPPETGPGPMRYMVMGKPRPNTDPNFTFEVPANWKTLDDSWSELLNDKNFFNEKPKDS